MIERYDRYKQNFIQSSISDNVQDPLHITFGIRFEFFPRSAPGESLEPGLLSGATRRYLSSRNDTLRVQKLDYFHTALKTFSIVEPWWFTEISGLDNILHLHSNGSRLPEDASITIKARESLDMKFLSLMESYRSIVYDKAYMRDMLPLNLKRFDMSIFITDIRTLVKPDGKNMVYEDDKQGVMVLKLYDCEFDFDNHGGFLSSIGNTKVPEETTHSFNIKVRRVYEEYNLPTGYIFGYGGNGYFSDDEKDDFNFISNVLRPKAMILASLGNERKINEEDYQDFIQRKRLDITNVAEEDVEKINEVGDIFVEGEEVDKNLKEKQILPKNTNQPNLSLGKLEGKGGSKDTTLNPTILEIISAQRRNIL